MTGKRRITSILASVMLMAIFTGCKDKPAEAGGTATPEPSPATQETVAVKADQKSLVGEWTRTDAPYQLKITAAGDSGQLTAGYFNPKPIHVGKSAWTTNADSLKVYVELQDENYPGSNYSLVYIPGKNLLAGTYFQAVEGETYTVEFIRTK